jgi:hypothetical protein
MIVFAKAEISMVVTRISAAASYSLFGLRDKNLTSCEAAPFKLFVNVNYDHYYYW